MAETCCVTFPSIESANLNLHAGQDGLVKEAGMTAKVPSWEAVDTDEVGAGVVRWEARERLELGSQRGWVDEVWTSEANDLLRVAALFQHQVRPVAGSGSVIVGESFDAGHILRHAELALEVVLLAQTLFTWFGQLLGEVVLACPRRVRNHLTVTALTVNGPVVATVLMNGTVAVPIQQAVLAQLFR